MYELEARAQLLGQLFERAPVGLVECVVVHHLHDQVGIVDGCKRLQSLGHHLHRLVVGRDLEGDLGQEARIALVLALRLARERFDDLEQVGRGERQRGDPQQQQNGRRDHIAQASDRFEGEPPREQQICNRGKTGRGKQLRPHPAPSPLPHTRHRHCHQRDESELVVESWIGAFERCDRRSDADENETEEQPNPHPRRDHARNQRDQSRRAGERSEEKGGVEQQNHVSWCGAGARQIRPCGPYSNKRGQCS